MCSRPGAPSRGISESIDPWSLPRSMVRDEFDIVVHDTDPSVAPIDTWNVVLPVESGLYVPGPRKGEIETMIKYDLPPTVVCR
jgi:hypothetical protein